MIQILGLREKTFKNGEVKKIHAFFENKWTAPSVGELLRNPSQYVEQIPEEERVNLYFTVHECEGKAARDFTEQFYIPFDIDDVPWDLVSDVAKVACNTLKVNFEMTGVVASGHGVQMFVELDHPITDMSFFDNNRKVYKLVADEIQAALKAAKLPGDVDTSVFSARRLMRMPETLNVKPEKENKIAKVIQGHTEPQGWLLENVLSAPGQTPDGTITKEVFKNYPPVDVDAVLEGCDFLKHCYERPNDVTEYQWYAMVGITGHMPDGRELTHRYSKKYAKYSPAETDRKIDQALNAAGPRTCKNIETLWDGCPGCPNYGKCTSPISIRSENYIATKDTGFYYVEMQVSGATKRTPAFEDIVKYYKQKNGPTFSAGNGALFTYNKKKKVWEDADVDVARSFFYNNFDPRPRDRLVNEAMSTLVNSEARKLEFFDRTPGLVNLQNGVYDIHANKLVEHSPEYGFKNILPFAYDEHATCPTFEKFLDDIMQKDEALKNILMEFVGYIISGDECWLHKSLILLGEGSNGKSTFNDVLKELLGPSSYSAVGLDQIHEPQYIYQLVGVLCNIADETPMKALLNSSSFKNIVAGGDMPVKKLYTQPYMVKNRAKLIFNCNQMLKSQDNSEGLYRRMVFIPFDAYFEEGKNENKHIKYELFKELPGIFNWALRGYRQLKKNQRLTSSEKSAELLDLMKDGQNDVQEWYSDNLIVTKKESDTLDIDEIYKNYLDWCETTKRKYPDIKQNVGYKLRNMFRKDGVLKVRKLENGRKRTCYTGIKFLEKEDIF